MSKGSAKADDAATVRVSRRFEASAERVFDAWLSPAMIGRFMFGPALRDEEVLRIEVDARVGGAFSFLVRRQGQEIDHVGHCLEIDRPRRLSFSWGIVGESDEQSQVDIEITGLTAGCELVLVHRMDPQWGLVRGSRQGWLVDNARRAPARARGLGQRSRSRRSAQPGALLHRGPVVLRSRQTESDGARSRAA